MRSSPVARFFRLTALLLLVGTAQVLPATAPDAVAAPPPVAGELQPYEISGVHSAGVSSGGYMATQLHVAYSGTFDGSAAFASGPNYCAQNNLNKALYACMDTMQDLQLDRLEQTTRDWSAQGLIDPVSNLSGDPVYVFSGSNDSTVKRPVADALSAYYQRFGARVLHNRSTAAGHAWISPLGSNSCTVTQNPWINNCGFDAERELLGHLLGPVAPPAATAGGSMIRFDQAKYAPGGSATAISMDQQGFVYVPRTCEDGASCTLVVALHGCKQGYSYQGFGSRFMDQAHLNEYADTNNLIVLYPQAVTTGTLDNPNGCWNWWGYQGDSAYAHHGGKQIETIMAMVEALGGRAPAPDRNETTIPSTDTQDGYVKAGADGAGAAVGTLDGSYGLAVGRGSDGKYNRTVLSFDTSRIPADKEITRAFLTVTRNSGSGDPWAAPAGNRLLVDVQRGCLSGCGVEASDWNAGTTAAGAAEITPLQAGTTSSGDLSAAGLAAVDRTGTTQVRLRFAANQPSTAYLFIAQGAGATLTVEYR